MPDINKLITDWGYAGIFLVVILGNIGLPVPEETVLAVAGTRQRHRRRQLWVLARAPLRTGGG